MKILLQVTALYWHGPSCHWNWVVYLMLPLTGNFLTLQQLSSFSVTLLDELKFRLSKNADIKWGKHEWQVIVVREHSWKRSGESQRQSFFIQDIQILPSRPNMAPFWNYFFNFRWKNKSKNQTGGVENSGKGLAGLRLTDRALGGHKWRKKNKKENKAQPT